ncbi:MAG: leucine-rich repeat domain-containing protein [Solibacillus sp.]
MKKMSIILMILLVGLCLVGTKASAEVRAYGDVLYELVAKPNGKKEVIIVGKNGLKKDIVIPATIKTYPVTEIADHAFYTPASDYQNHILELLKNEAYLAQLITSVTLPNSVKRIGVNAFTANQLTEVTLPANLEEIGNDAFLGNNLKSIALPKKLKTIGRNAFASNKLTTLTIPNSVTALLGDIVAGNPINTVNLPVHLQTKKEKTYNDLYYTIMQNNGKKEVKITGYNPKTKKTKLVIPAQINNLPVTEIGHFAFTPYSTALGLEQVDYSKKVIHQFSLPNSIRKIGTAAFENTNFNHNVEVKLPTKLVEIGDYAFASNMMSNEKKQFVIPSKVKILGKSAFMNNQLRGVTLPNSVTTLGEDVFSSNSMNKVVIGSGVSSIPTAAFSGNRISSLTLPKTLKRIGDAAFMSNQLPRVVLPDQISYIGEDAFSFNVITSAKLPKKLITLGNRAFLDNQLTSLTIPASIIDFDFQTVASNPIKSVVIQGAKTTIKQSYLDPAIKGVYTNATFTNAWSNWNTVQTKPITLYMKY